MIEKKAVSELVEEFLKESSSFLVDINITPGNIVSVEIDNDEGVSIDECVALNKFIESQLDREEEDYELNIGSAGLTSPLKSVRQYKKYIDKEVEVLSKDGKKLSGLLKEVNDSNFTITVTKKVKLEGAKRKQDVSEDYTLSYEEIKHTKYLIRFK